MALKPGGGQTAMVTLPRAMASFLNRIFSLPEGVFLIQLVKTGGGAAGVSSWSVMLSGALERPREECRADGMQQVLDGDATAAG